MAYGNYGTIWTADTMKTMTEWIALNIVYRNKNPQITNQHVNPTWFFRTYDSTAQPGGTNDPTLPRNKEGASRTFIWHGRIQLHFSHARKPWKYANKTHYCRKNAQRVAEQLLMPSHSRKNTFQQKCGFFEMRRKKLLRVACRDERIIVTKTLEMWVLRLCHYAKSSNCHSGRRLCYFLCRL